MANIDSLKKDREAIASKINYQSGAARERLQEELAEIDRAIKNEEEKNPALKRPRGEGFSFKKGMRRGGETDSNRYISRETAERYANIYGSEAAEKRFSEPKKLKTQSEAGMERRAEEEKIAREAQQRIEAEMKRQEPPKIMRQQQIDPSTPRITINQEAAPSRQPNNPEQPRGNQRYYREPPRNSYDDRRARRQEAYDELKDFGRVMGRGASAAGRGVGKAASGIGSLLSFNFKRVPEDREISGTDFLIILILVVHALEIVWLNLNITNTDALFIRGALHLLILFAVKSVLKDQAPGLEAWRMWVVIVILIPALGHGISIIGNADHLRIFSGALLLFPLWLFYLVKLKGVKASSGKLANLANITLSALIFLTILYFFYLFAQAFTATGIIEDQQDWFTPREAILGAGEFLGGILSTIYSSIIGIGPWFGNTTDLFLRQTLGEYYTGRVEENVERTGVFIENFRTTETFYENYPIIISGTLRARSFVDNVTVRLSCEARDNRGEIWQGVATPSEIIIYGQDQQAVFCTFNNSLPAGRPEVTLKAEFSYETWAYTTYTFMTREYMSSLVTADEDVNRKFNIDRRPETIYTAGPVMLGMADRIELPILINTNADSNVPVGITLDNRMGGFGNIQSVERYMFKLPEEFSLTMCTREIKEERSAELEGYKVYVFENPTPELVQYYMTVSCNMHLPRDNVVSLMRNNLQSAMEVTLVGVAKYDYLLRGREFITVRQDPTAQVNQNE